MGDVTSRVARNYPLATAWFVSLTIITLLNSGFIYIVTKRVATQSAKVARIEAVKQATAASTQERCRASLPVLRSFNTHVKGVNELADTLVKNTWVSRNSVPHSDPQWRTRNANLNRIKRVREAIGALTGIPLPRC